MKLVIQRVSGARVKIKGKVVGKIGKGIFVLLGVGQEDSKKDAERLVEKLVKLRVMADEQGKMNLSIMETTKDILVVSQFTLYADTKKGNRPSFIKAAGPDKARDLYRHFVAKLVEKGVKVETGEFGEYMKIELELDGPVTIILVS